jgi:hypothetical protein
MYLYISIDLFRNLYSYICIYLDDYMSLKREPQALKDTLSWEVLFCMWWLGKTSLRQIWAKIRNDPCVYSRGQLFRQKEQQVKRPWSGLDRVSSYSYSQHPSTPHDVFMSMQELWFYSEWSRKWLYWHRQIVVVTLF